MTTAADQERYRMLRGIRMMAGHVGVDRFELVHKAVGHQEIERAIHGGRCDRTGTVALAHPLKQVVSLDRLAGIGDQPQHVTTDRGQPQAAFAAGALDRAHERRRIIDMMLRVGAGMGCVSGHVWMMVAMSPRLKPSAFRRSSPVRHRSAPALHRARAGPERRKCRGRWWFPSAPRASAAPACRGPIPAPRRAPS